MVVDKFSALALSILFRILTHGYGFQNTRRPAVGNSHCTFTKISASAGSTRFVCKIIKSLALLKDGSFVRTICAIRSISRIRFGAICAIRVRTDSSMFS